MRFYCSNTAGRRAQAAETMQDITRILAEEDDALIQRHLRTAHAELETAERLLEAKHRRQHPEAVA